MRMKIVKNSFSRIGEPSSKSNTQVFWCRVSMPLIQLGDLASRLGSKASSLSSRNSGFECFQNKTSSFNETSLVRGLA